MPCLRRADASAPKYVNAIAATAVRFARDTRAATAIEFAFVSVPFLGLLFAIFETALVFFTMQSIEAATSDAARQILTGQAQSNTTVTTAEQFKSTYLCNSATRIIPGYVDCSKIVVDVRTSSDWSNADLSSNFMTESTHKYCTGSSNEIMVLRVGYPMPVYLSILAMSGFGNSQVYQNTSGQTNYNGAMSHMLVATSVFRNEPFPGVAPLAGC